MRSSARAKRRSWIQSLVVAGAVLLCLARGHGSELESDFIRAEEEEARVRRSPEPGWLWDLDVGPRAFPRDTSLGRSLSHRRPGVYEGLNELNGNLMMKFGPLFMNTLGHDNLSMNARPEVPQPDVAARIVQQRDKSLYGSPGLFSLALYDVFLFDEAAVDNAADPATINSQQTSLKMILEDRTMVTFRPSTPGLMRGTADSGGYVATPHLQSRVDYVYGRDEQRVTFEDGRVWVFGRVKEPGGTGACDWEWNHTLLNAFIWAPDQRIRDYMFQVRANVNRIYALTKEIDRYGNETVITRDTAAASTGDGNMTNLCRISRIVENRMTAGASEVENTTVLTYEGILVDGSTHEMLRSVRLFADTPDEKVYTLGYNEYSKSRLKRPPHLISLRFAEVGAALADTAVTCFQFHFPYEGTDTGEGILRSIEGPYAASLRMPMAATGYCHPDPPSNVVGGAQSPVGPVVAYRLDKLGHVREIVRPDGTGLELFFSPERAEVAISHTWPMVRPRTPGDGTYERDEHTDAPAARMSQSATTLIVAENPTDHVAQVVRRTDNFGRFWTYARNAEGYVTAIDSYDGQHTTLQYEADDTGSAFRARNRPLVYSITDTYGSRRTFRYDDWGRVVYEQGPSNVADAGPRTERQYHGPGPFMGMLARVTTFGRDPFTGQELREEIAYDQMSPGGGMLGIRETHTTAGPDGTPESVSSLLAMDPSGRARSFLNPAGILEQVTYNGNRETFEIGVPGDGMQPFGELTRSATGAPSHVVDQWGVETGIDYTPTGQLQRVEDSNGLGFAFDFDERLRLQALTAFPESGALDDQNATIRIDRDNACGFTTGVSTGIGDEWEADLQYTVTTPYQTESGERVCGYFDELPDCPSTATTPAACAARNTLRMAYVYCESPEGCGQCFPAYSDDRYCLDVGGFITCGGSCTSYDRPSTSVCPDLAYWPYCPVSPPGGF